MAGILLGQQLIYLDAGSGAKEVVPQNVISAISNLTVPIIVGGGIRSAKQIQEAHESGAAVVVIGNHIEKHLDFLLDIQLYKSEQTLNA
jgi:putative glycerol-1-phosphate prenyltransferase